MIVFRLMGEPTLTRIREANAHFHLRPRIPACPRWLRAGAVAWYRRLRRLLQPARIVTLIDRDALANLASTLFTFDQLSRHARKATSALARSIARSQRQTLRIAKKLAKRFGLHLSR